MFHLLSIGLVALVPTPDVFAEVSGARYGSIKIVGNTDTPDRVILNQLGGIAPGAKVSAADLRTLRKRLAALNTTPTVLLLVSEFDSAFLDLWIAVVEQPGNWFAFGLWGLFETAPIALVTLDPELFRTEWAWFRARWQKATAP